MKPKHKGLSIQSTVLFQYIGNNDLQFNSFMKGTKNSFSIKRLIQVPSLRSCIAKAINKYFCLMEVRHCINSILIRRTLHDATKTCDVRQKHATCDKIALCKRAYLCDVRHATVDCDC